LVLKQLIYIRKKGRGLPLKKDNNNKRDGSIFSGFRLGKQRQAMGLNC
jgi:hypothetical protein